MPDLKRYAVALNSRLLEENAEGPLMRYEDVQPTLDAMTAEIQRLRSALRAVKSKVCFASASSGLPCGRQDIASRALVK